MGRVIARIDRLVSRLVIASIDRLVISRLGLVIARLLKGRRVRLLIARTGLRVSRKAWLLVARLERGRVAI